MLRRYATAALLLGCASSTGPRAAGVDLPVTRVVLYQNGVGYFERQGKVEGNVLSLRVKPGQVNDLLKSLTVIDAAGGRVVSASLPIAESGRHLLAELPEQVRQAGGLLAILHAFRGARVVVSGEQGTAKGRIAGLEPVGAGPRDDDEAGARWRLTLKTDDRELLVYDVGAIEKVRLDDATLSVGLDKSLDIALDEGQWKPVSITIQLAGDRSHDLLVSYIAEMPLWKPAYRLVVDGGERDEVLVQGWAVVDNVSGEDWNGARLSLVAGQPMSFQYNLHAPRTKRRMDLTPSNDELAYVPVQEESGYVPAPPAAAGAPPPAPVPQRSVMAKKSKSVAKEYSKGNYADDEDAMDEPAPLADRLAAQAHTAVQTTKVGALFRYDLRDPVNVPDGSSTLVSIINERVPGKEVVLFRPEEDANKPYRAVLFTNGSTNTLEKGPVAIYVGGTFAGEGFVPFTEPGTTGFVTFAVDAGVGLKRSDRSSEEGFRLLRIVNGILETSAVQVARTTYEVHNKHQEAVTAYIKTARRGGWTLRNKPEGTVETADALFVPVKALPQQSGEASLEWVSPTKRRLAVDTDASTQVLKAYLGSGTVPAGIAKPLEEILKLKARLGAIAQDEAELTKQRDTLTRDGERLRANIDLLRKSPGNRELMQGLIDKLAKLEGELGKSSEKLVRLSEERAEIGGKMTVLISQVTVLDVDK